jgi:hypothetical protein
MCNEGKRVGLAAKNGLMEANIVFLCTLKLSLYRSSKLPLYWGLTDAMEI